MDFVREYGTGTGSDIIVNLLKAGSDDFAVAADWTPAAGDVKISKDGGAAVNIGTLPVYITDVGWKFVFTDAELTAKRIGVRLADAAVKAVQDDSFSLVTANHQDALFPNGVVRKGTAQGGGASSITLDAGASGVDDFYNDGFIETIGGTGTGQWNFISDYTGATKAVATMKPWLTQPDGTTVFRIFAGAADHSKYTAAKAAFLDAAITSRPAGTDYTAGRATKLDFLDSSVAGIQADTDNIQTRLPAALDTGRIIAKAEVVTDKTGYTMLNPAGLVKNTAKNNFTFLMLDSADHVTPKTGLAVTAQRSLDGAAFGACANAPVELGNGVYRINLTSADLNGDVVTFKFTATGADQTTITVVTI